LRLTHLEKECRSIDWLVKLLIKMDAEFFVRSVLRWHVHVASVFPLSHHYREVLG
jgi:hypothetical protein